MHEQPAKAHRTLHVEAHSAAAGAQQLRGHLAPPRRSVLAHSLQSWQCRAAVELTSLLTCTNCHAACPSTALNAMQLETTAGPACL